jgi:hypothetical protein
VTSDLLGEIEREAVQANADLPTLLHKCIALGGISGSVALREWATRELKGYGDGDTLPPYRTIAAILALDGATMAHRVTGQQISPASLPDIARDLIKEEVRLYGPIAELTDAIKDARNQENNYINFGIPEGSTLTALTNHHLREKGVEYQTIERIYWKAGVTSLVGVVDTVQTNLAGVVDTVQTNLVELVAELRAGVGRGHAVPDKDLTDRAVNIVIYGDKNRVEVAHAVADAGGTAETNAAPERESKAKTIMYWVAGVATVAAAAIALLVWYPW